MDNAAIAELLQQAHEELEQVNITYQDWKERCAPAGYYEQKGLDPATATHWGKGFALIKEAQKALAGAA